MNAEFRNLVQQDRRLVILRFLLEDPGYRLNTSVLQTALESVGHGCSRDCVDAECAWLAELGLVRLETVGSVTVVHLTGRGEDVAAGRCAVPGIKRPRPKGV